MKKFLLVTTILILIYILTPSPKYISWLPGKFEMKNPVNNYNVTTVNNKYDNDIYSFYPSEDYKINHIEPRNKPVPIPVINLDSKSNSEY
jgi:hypothetical protein